VEHAREHVPAKWKPVRKGEPLFADKDMRQLWNLRRIAARFHLRLAGPAGLKPCEPAMILQPRYAWFPPSKEYFEVWANMS